MYVQILGLSGEEKKNCRAFVVAPHLYVVRPLSQEDSVVPPDLAPIPPRSESVALWEALVASNTAVGLEWRR